jgi:hypothetical protein
MRPATPPGSSFDQGRFGIHVLRPQEFLERIGLPMNVVTRQVLLAYRDGHLSLSVLSQALGMSVSEAMDLLASFGLQAPITYDEYLEGRQTLRDVIR